MPPLIPPPADRLFHRLDVPALRMAAPEIVFPERIPPSVTEALQPIWTHGYAERTIGFYRLTDVFVVGEGLVFTRDLQLLQPSVTQHDPALIVERLRTLQTAMAAGTVPHHPGTTLLCGKIGMSNYGHWMVEMAPIAYLSRRWLIDGQWKIYLPHVYPWMAEVVDRSLTLLDIPLDTRLAGSGEARHFEELVLVINVSEHGRYYSPYAVEAMDHISQTIQPGLADRVWVSRAGERRTMRDETTLCQVLADRGWHILRPREAPLAEQIAAAKGARLMAGVNGAGLTNLGFMAPGGAVLDFMPASMPDIFYWQLAHHRGTRYREIRCPVHSDPAWSIEWDGVLQLSMHEVLDQVETFEAGP